MLRDKIKEELKLIQESNKRLMGEGHEWQHGLMQSIIDNVSELEMGQDMDTDYVDSLIDNTISKLYELRWKMGRKD